MTTITFAATLREDGTLAVPDEVTKELGLHPGDQVQVRVEAANGATATSEPKMLDPGEEVEVSVRADEATERAGVEEPARNPLYNIIGLGKAGKVDGAENHDRYLYGRDHDQAQKSS